jgi:uracil phosphoribosyltransferase (EC 2.4.2.9)
VSVDVYYVRIPDVEGSVVLIADPMLATGVTMASAIREVLKRGTPKRLLV